MSDEELGRRLPELLTDAVTAPSTVDIGRAIRAGKRRRNVRYAVGGVAVLAVITAIPVAVQSHRPDNPPVTWPTVSPSATPSAVAQACSVSATPKGFKRLVTDPTGTHFTGVIEDGAAPWKDGITGDRPAIWRDGKVERVGIPTGSDGWGVAVNARGVAIGVAGSPDGYGAFTSVDLETMSLPDSAETNVSAISDSGVIVGRRRLSSGKSIPIRWRSPSHSPEDLPLPQDATGGEATIVLADGTAIGGIHLKTPTPLGQSFVPYMWPPDGNGRRMPVPDGFALMLDGSGGDWVHGSYHPNPAAPVAGAFVLNVRTQEFRHFPDFVIQGRGSVTADGWFAGHWRYAAQRHLLTDGTTSLDLPLPAGVALGGIDSVAADGKVVTGHTLAPSGHVLTPEAHAGVIWRC